MKLRRWYRAAVEAIHQAGERAKALKPDIDLRDAHIYGGLLIAAIGGWQLSWPWTCIILGVLVTVLGIFAPRMARGGE